MNPNEPNTNTPRASAQRTRVVAVSSVAVPALGLLGAWGCAWAWRAWPGMAWSSAALTAAPWAAMLALWGVGLVAWLRSRGTPREALAVLSVTALMATAPASLALGLICNGLSASAPPEQRRVVIAGTTREGAPDDAQHLLHLKSWRAGKGATVDVRVTPRALEQARIGQWVVVTTQRGGLGAEWVESVCTAPKQCLELQTPFSRR